MRLVPRDIQIPVGWIENCALFIVSMLEKLKGHWTTSASSPQFFFQKSLDSYTIRSVYLCSYYLLNLTCNFNLITKIW